MRSFRRWRFVKAMIDLRGARACRETETQSFAARVYPQRKRDYTFSPRSTLRTARHSKVWSLRALESSESPDVSRDQCESDFTKLPFSFAKRFSLSLLLSISPSRSPLPSLSLSLPFIFLSQHFYLVIIFDLYKIQFLQIVIITDSDCTGKNNSEFFFSSFVCHVDSHFEAT